MKKINLAIILLFLFVAFSINLNAQINNTTIIVKDKIDENYFKRHTKLNVTLAGFNNLDEVKKVIDYISTNGNIAKCEITGNDGKGNYNVFIEVKAPQEFVFYKSLAIKTNIQYVEFNGEKKIISELK